MKTIKRAGSVIKFRIFKDRHKEKFILDLIKRNKGNGYLRKGNFSSEVIWDGKSYSFPKMGDGRSYSKGIFLFAMVRKDAKSFLKKGGKVRMPKRYPVNEYNQDFLKLSDKITGTDLNHAYWRIAFNLGIITRSTYSKGLEDDLKMVRLAALSTLGKGKDYYTIKDGVITNEVVTIGTDEDMDRLYRAIRFTCYDYMQIIKEKLGKDFVAYKTDCVYYLDTKENRKMVRGFFKENQMTTKQLTFIKKTLHEQSSF